MKNPARIHDVLEMLADYWLERPDLRLGQLIMNLGVDYYTEDEELLRTLDAFASYDIDAHK